MNVLTVPFVATTLVLTVLAAASPAGATPADNVATTPGNNATRAAVAAYNKQHREARQELSADTMKHMQGFGRLLLSAQAGLQNSTAEEALRQELNALHDELAQAMTVASMPRFSHRPAAAETTTVERVKGPLRVNARLHIASGRLAIVKGAPQRPSDTDAVQRTVHVGKEMSATRHGDDFARVRARLDALRPRIKMASQISESGAALEHREHSAQLLRKAAQLGDEVRAAIDAGSTPASQRKLAELRDRLREKSLNEVLGTSSTPVTPTFTTLVQHR
jgi:hypothetical protein